VQVGGAIGLAVLATLATERTAGLQADGAATAFALNSGYHLAYVVGAVLVAGAFVLTLTVLRSDRPQGAEEGGALPARAELACSEAA
jgi:hypothetical protein